MMEFSKIHLSSAETELMKDAGVILTKNSVLQKIKLLLEQVQQMQSGFAEEHQLRKTIPFIISPKISKGENYLGLPYIILDYPRQSGSGNFFFIRTLFWWGHFFSCTLHISGSDRELFFERISASFPFPENYFIGIGDDPWAHHFEEDNYKPAATISKSEFEKLHANSDHIKIAARWPLEEWGEVPQELFACWKFFLSACGLVP